MQRGSTMRTTITMQGEAVRLAPRAIFTIDDAAGVQLASSEGELWITLDNDPRDIILSPGESFLTTQHRRAVIYALTQAQLTVRRPCAALAAPDAPRWTQRVLGSRELGAA